MEILKEFGVNPVLLVAQVINFLIVLYILKRFLYKPILTVVKKREESIKEGLKQAEEAKILMEKTAEKERTVLKKAQEESRKLLEDTKKQRDEIFKATEESAQKRSLQILNEAKKQISFETIKAQKELSMQISDLASEFLQKSAGDLFGKEEQELIIKNALRKMKKRVD